MENVFCFTVWTTLAEQSEGKKRVAAAADWTRRTEKKLSVVTRIERASTLECTWLQEPHILYVDFNLEKYNYSIGTDQLLILFYYTYLYISAKQIYLWKEFSRIPWSNLGSFEYKHMIIYD